MIKVVARKVENNLKPMKVVCWDCCAEIEYDEEDIVDNRIKCPDCGASIWVGEEGKEIPKFPDSFYHFGVNAGAVKLSEETIANYVKETVEALKEEPINSWAINGAGDTAVIGLRSEECDTIIVCKNYWEDSYNHRL